MKYLDLGLSSPAQDLALEEVLLDACDAGAEDEVLRLWGATDYFVVVGCGNVVETEVNVPACRAARVPILRRISGGGTVLQGPGCLNYAVILRTERSPETETVAGTNRYVLGRVAATLSTLASKPVEVRGQTDLVLGDRKVSGNSQRRKRRALLYHGSILCGLDFSRVEQFLRPPSRQPEYRRDRRHRDFLANLNVDRDLIKSALRISWDARGAPDRRWLDASRIVAAERYEREEWNLRR